MNTAEPASAHRFVARFSLSCFPFAKYGWALHAFEYYHHHSKINLKNKGVGLERSLR